MTTIQKKLWHVGLWILQVLLAGMFIMAGWMKTFTPTAELPDVFPALADLPLLTRFIGISELAGGLGLLLPAGLRILPRLTSTSAYALSFVMILALLFHLLRGEYAAITTNIVLAVIGLIIGWGRSVKAPITPRPLVKTV